MFQKQEPVLSKKQKQNKAKTQQNCVVKSKLAVLGTGRGKINSGLLFLTCPVFLASCEDRYRHSRRCPQVILLNGKRGRQGSCPRSSFIFGLNTTERGGRDRERFGCFIHTGDIHTHTHALSLYNIRYSHAHTLSLYNIRYSHAHTHTLFI